MTLNTAAFFARVPRFFRRHRLMRAWMSLRNEDPIQLVRVNGENSVFVDLRDGFMRQIVIESEYDEEFFRVATPFMRSSGDFLDVGANFGICSFGLVGVPSPRIRTFHLFEPNPQLIPVLERTRQRYPQEDIRIVKRCVSDQRGNLRFHVVAEQTGISHIDPHGDVVVQSVTIDDYIREAGIREIAMMKVDVEGYELKVFRGATKALSTGQIPAVYFEHFPSTIRQEGGEPEEVLALLRSLGFDLWFCRSDDPNTVERGLSVQHLDVNGTRIPIWRIDDERLTHNTDLLATWRRKFTAF